jgi:hypothetical protein
LIVFEYSPVFVEIPRMARPTTFALPGPPNFARS